MKIDVFTHILPSDDARRMSGLGDTPAAGNIRERIAGVPSHRPERFAGFVAALPLADVDDAIAEARRAGRDLGDRGATGGSAGGS